MTSTVTKRGFFITFEGGEGSGKSTQVALLESFLKEKNIPCLKTREPGGSPGAELIRGLILQGDVARWDALTEYLLFSAARRDHLMRKVKPALDAGTWVICDRYIDSSRVYQGMVQHLPIPVIESIYKSISEGIEPDLTLLLDIPVQEGLKRANNRNTLENRFEKKGEAFHEQVREAFLKLAEKYVSRYHVLSANQSVEALQQSIQNVVESRLLTFLPAAV